MRASSRRVRQFGHRIVSHLLGLLVCVAVWVFLIVAAFELPTRTVTPLRFGGAAVGLALPALVPMAIAPLLWIHVRAGTRASNWVARLDETGLYLHLRSWLNWRLSNAERTVAFTPYEAIANVHEVREQSDVYRRVSGAVADEGNTTEGLTFGGPLTQLPVPVTFRRTLTGKSGTIIVKGSATLIFTSPTVAVLAGTWEVESATGSLKQGRGSLDGSANFGATPPTASITYTGSLSR